jgi:predicted deacylase
MIGELLTAFGHTIVNEFVSAEYLKKNLHRSVSGAVLNTARIPAFTVELGGYMSVDPAIVLAAVTGLRNVMRHVGMLDDAPEVIAGIRILTPGFPVRRMMHPYAPESGIVQFLIKSGDSVTAGDPIACLTDIYGRPLGPSDGLIASEYDGYVLGLNLGAVCYQNDPLLSLLVRDDGDLVLPFPN